MIAAVHTHINEYRLDLASQCLYEFIWNEYCGWYLELSKPVLQKGSADEQNATRYTLLYVLERSLRTLHPFIPYITEEEGFFFGLSQFVKSIIIHIGSFWN